ncbi:hypothetical protein DOK76_12445 [Vagococcus sp. DIV0080]|uniref:Uncharacterized protein n=1 Tax=Candidatus Vagococcus giribetii TaxID=2230876 RepID=A0ABS3HVU9_9ENTE|nr:hypothetical protein [Vagococcus sp. DIV0080]MBO0477883.1 hypothetical protein [Vagococcus sp. DIV0080]
MKQFVQLNYEGYISGWFDSKDFATCIEVTANPTHVGLLDCVKVANGVTILDEVKQKELLQEKGSPTEMEQLKLENIKLKEILENTKEDVTNTQVALTEVFELIETLI